MDYQEIIRKKLSDKRYGHSVRVADVAEKLAISHGMDVEKARVAGLLHDYCKEWPKKELVKVAVEQQLLTSRQDLLMPQILHGPVAAYVLNEEGLVEDIDILQAIRYHTVGHPDMDDLTKIIFIADYIEPGRTTPNIDDLFGIAEKDLDRCVIEIIDRTAGYLISGHKIIHEDMIKLRNKLLSKE